MIKLSDDSNIEDDEEFDLNCGISHVVKQFAISLVKKLALYVLNEEQLSILRQDENFVNSIKEDESEVKHYYEAFMNLTTK
jgi:hypothetical protein